MHNKRIAVFGGAGFIGSNLVSSLKENQNEIVVIDNLSTGKLDNIKELVDRKEIEFVKGNIVDYSFVYQILKDFNIDVVFHLAAQVSIPISLIDTNKTHNVNITGTYNILEASRHTDVKKVVYSSSCAIYGNIHQEKAIVESDMPQILNPYALTKLVGEYYCNMFSSCFGLQCVSLRYFNVYGPRQDPNGEYAAVIPKFIEKIRSKQSPVIFGDGLQTRDFVFVNDVVNANILAADRNVQGVFNIATGVKTSVNDLAIRIMSIFCEDYEIIHKDPRPSEIKDSVANISKAKNELQFENSYSLNEGLEKTINWFNNI